MDLAYARDILRSNHRAVLATARADGRAQLSPIVTALDAHDHLLISTRETAVKVANIRRDHKVSMCVLADNFFGAWIQVDGVAEIVHLPEAMDSLVSLYRTISGEHPDWDDYRTAMHRERRVILRISIERVGPERSG